MDWPFEDDHQLPGKWGHPKHSRGFLRLRLQPYHGSYMFLWKLMAISDISTLDPKSNIFRSELRPTHAAEARIRWAKSWNTWDVSTCKVDRRHLRTQRRGGPERVPLGQIRGCFLFGQQMIGKCVDSGEFHDLRWLYIYDYICILK